MYGLKLGCALLVCLPAHKIGRVVASQVGESTIHSAVDLVLVAHTHERRDSVEAGMLGDRPGMHAVSEVVHEKYRVRSETLLEPIQVDAIDPGTINQLVPGEPISGFGAEVDPSLTFG